MYPSIRYTIDDRFSTESRDPCLHDLRWFLRGKKTNPTHWKLLEKRIIKVGKEFVTQSAS